MKPAVCQAPFRPPIRPFIRNIHVLACMFIEGCNNYCLKLKTSGEAGLGKQFPLNLLVLRAGYYLNGFRKEGQLFQSPWGDQMGIFDSDHPFAGKDCLGLYGNCHVLG